MPTFLARPDWVDGAANMSRASVELAGDIANQKADAFNVLLVSRGSPNRL